MEPGGKPAWISSPRTKIPPPIALNDANLPRAAGAARRRGTATHDDRTGYPLAAELAFGPPPTASAPVRYQSPRSHQSCRNPTIKKANSGGAVPKITLAYPRRDLKVSWGLRGQPRQNRPEVGSGRPWLRPPRSPPRRRRPRPDRFVRLPPRTAVQVAEDGGMRFVHDTLPQRVCFGSGEAAASLAPRSPASARAGSC